MAFIATTFLRRGLNPNTFTTFASRSLKPQSSTFSRGFYNAGVSTTARSVSLSRGFSSTSARLFNSGVVRPALVQSSVSWVRNGGLLGAGLVGGCASVGMVGERGLIGKKKALGVVSAEELVVQQKKKREETHGLYLASRLRRFFAFMIDSTLGSFFCVIPYVGPVFTVIFVVFRDLATVNGSIGKHLLGLSILNEEKKSIADLKTRFLRSCSQFILVATGIGGFVETLTLLFMNERIGDMVLGLKVVELDQKPKIL